MNRDPYAPQSGPNKTVNASGYISGDSTLKLLEKYSASQRDS